MKFTRPTGYSNKVTFMSAVGELSCLPVSLV